MIATFWAKIDAAKRGGWWYSRTIKTSKNKPATKASEVAIKISIEIPDAYFETPELSATIKVPADSVNKPFITPEIQSNLGTLLSQQLGMQVRVSAESESEAA